MPKGRDQDFVILFMHGDVVVMPTAHLDGLLDRMMDDASASGFLDVKGFLLDETAMPAMTLPELQGPPPAEASAGH